TFANALRTLANSGRNQSHHLRDSDINHVEDKTVDSLNNKINSLTDQISIRSLALQEQARTINNQVDTLVMVDHQLQETPPTSSQSACARNQVSSLHAPFHMDQHPNQHQTSSIGSWCTHRCFEAPIINHSSTVGKNRHSSNSSKHGRVRRPR
ncbi:hypothetical protein HDU97_009886, partial [Phlyctochytrium planicorne]